MVKGQGILIALSHLIYRTVSIESIDGFIVQKSYFKSSEKLYGVFTSLKLKNSNIQGSVNSIRSLRLDSKDKFFSGELKISEESRKLARMHAALVAALIIIGLIFIAMGLLRRDFNLMLYCPPENFDPSDSIGRNKTEKRNR